MLKKLMSFLLLPMLWISSQGTGLEWNHFQWGKSKSEWSSSGELKERWTGFLLRECVRSQLEKEFMSLGIEYEINAEEGLFPCCLSGSFLAEANRRISSLEDVTRGNLLDFSIEFAAAQEFWMQWIHAQNKEELPNDWQRDPPFESSFSYAEFLQQSEKIVQDLSLMDIVIAFNSQGSHEIKSGYAKSSAPQKAYLPTKKGWEPAPGIGRGGEPKSEESQLFFDLPLTDEDKKNIRYIITMMAEKNVIQLLLDKKNMEKKGDQIQPVHPLRFAGFVLTDPVLKRSMKAVSKNHWKWDGFLDGYEKRLREEKRAGTLDCYVPGLADLLEVDRSVIQRYINQENYGGLIKHFL